MNVNKVMIFLGIFVFMGAWNNFLWPLILLNSVTKKTITIGAVDGLATIIGGGIPILPYLFLPTFKAMLVAIGVVIVVISIIGLYLGRLSKRNMIMSAFKMAVFCIVVAALVYLVQSLIVPAQH